MFTLAIGFFLAINLGPMAPDAPHTSQMRRRPPRAAASAESAT